MKALRLSFFCLTDTVLSGEEAKSLFLPDCRPDRKIKKTAILSGEEIGYAVVIMGVSRNGICVFDDLSRFGFVFKHRTGNIMQRLSLGFAAVLMIAASIWSLLIPAIEDAKSRGMIGWIPAAAGFAGGVMFMLLLDKLIPHIHA